MARTVKDTRIDTRAARRSLPCQSAPYWRTIHEGLHLGYRKGKRGGKWVLRWYNYDSGKYLVETLGTADDESDADGIAVFDFKQAQAMARTRATEAAAEATGQHIGPYTVQDAMGDYHASMEHDGKATAKESRRRTELYILDQLGNVELSRLTRDMLTKWQKHIVSHPGFTRAGKAKPEPKFMKELPEPEGMSIAEKDEWEKEKAERERLKAEHIRRRKDSANRMLTILKAGLNHAFNEGKVLTNTAWAQGRVKAYRTVSKARVHYLTTEEVTRLINACPPGFRELVQGALYTGARYGDLCAMDAGDFNADAGTVTSGNSKASKPHAVYLTDEGGRFFERITAGRRRTDPMFPHPSGGRWGKSQQLRPMEAAVAAARIDTPASFHTLRHTYASHAVMAGVPLLVVAQNLGHSDTRMVEKHYGHLAKSWVQEKIRAGMPSWGDPGDDGKVARLGGAV